MNIEAWSLTDVGMVREHNEDSHLVDLERQLFVVADGVGGSSAGEVASGMLVDGMRESAAALSALAGEASPLLDVGHRERVFGAMVRRIQAINADVYEQGKGIDSFRPMATTCDVLLISGNAAFIGHVGDSRVYLFRNGQIFRITEDHTFAEQLKRDHVDEPQMIERYKNVLTRSIGGKPQVDIDTLFIDLEPGDRLLMCSDGLTDYLSGPEIEEMARLDTGEALLTNLVEEAKARGGGDNITTLLVHIGLDHGVRDTTLDTIRQADILGGIDLFRGLHIRELLRMMRAVYEQVAKEGEVILDHDTGDRSMYIIAEGEVDLFIDDKKVARLTQGQHFGEFSLVNDGPRTARAVAVGSTLLLVIPADKFRSVVDEDPVVGNRLLWNLLDGAVARLRYMNRTFVSGDDSEGGDDD
jgi:serine/threonine protein phosphatase PrpC